MEPTPPPGWSIDANGRFAREYRFPDFRRALAFVNRVADVAEELDHHPDVELGYGRVRLVLWSHDVNRTTGRDVRLARRIDALEE